MKRRKTYLLVPAYGHTYGSTETALSAFRGGQPFKDTKTNLIVTEKDFHKGDSITLMNGKSSVSFTNT